MATGRTPSKFVNIVIHDSGAVLRDIPWSSITLLGIVFEEQDLTAFQDAVKGALPNMPDAPISFSGPFSNAAAVAASGTGVVPALSGPHTVLEPLNGLFTALTVDFQFGIEQTWSTGDPQFGITASGNSGYLVFNYTLDPNTMLYTCEMKLKAGSVLPGWATSAET